VRREVIPDTVVPLEVFVEELRICILRFLQIHSFAFLGHQVRRERALLSLHSLHVASEHFLLGGYLRLPRLTPLLYDRRLALPLLSIPQLLVKVVCEQLWLEGALPHLVYKFEVRVDLLLAFEFVLPVLAPVHCSPEKRI